MRVRRGHNVAAPQADRRSRPGDRRAALRPGHHDSSATNTSVEGTSSATVAHGVAVGAIASIFLTFECQTKLSVTNPVAPSLGVGHDGDVGDAAIDHEGIDK